MSDPSKNIATNLKALRTNLGWSLDKTAAATGVSKAMLGKLERGESSPTISTLWKIADGLNVSFSTFIKDQTPAAESELQLTEQDLQVDTLFPFEQETGFEMYRLCMQPNYERLAPPHQPGVIEHLVMMSGEIEVLVDGDWQQLSAGDKLRFAADKPHGYRNQSDSAAVYHVMIHYTQAKV